MKYSDNKHLCHLTAASCNPFKALKLLLDCIIGSCKQER